MFWTFSLKVRIGLCWEIILWFPPQVNLNELSGFMPHSRTWHLGRCLLKKNSLDFTRWWTKIHFHMHILDHLGKNKLFLEFSLSQDISSSPRSCVIDFRRSFLRLWFPCFWLCHCYRRRWRFNCHTSLCGKGRQDFYDFVWSEAGDPARLCLCTDQKKCVSHYLTHTPVFLWNEPIRVWSESLHQNPGLGNNSNK